MHPDPIAPSATPSVYAALRVSARGNAPLSAAQQRYNAFLERIEALSGQIESLQAWSDRHRHTHVQALYQAAQDARAARQSLVLYLHERLQTDALTAQQQRMARTQLRLFLDQLGPVADPQLQALADLYRLDDAELAEERAQAAQRLREQIEAALGQPIHSPDQYPTPEAMMAAGMRQGSASNRPTMRARPPSGPRARRSNIPHSRPKTSRRMRTKRCARFSVNWPAPCTRTASPMRPCVRARRR